MSFATLTPQAQLIQVYRWLRQYGYNDSHSGNASIRLEQRLWVTPSGACADDVEPERIAGLYVLVFTDRVARWFQQPGASLDAPLHRLVYRLNPEARVVLHCHNPHCVALTLDGRDFTPPDFEGQLYFGTVPVLDIAYEDYVGQAPQRVAEQLATHKATIVRGHGVYVWGENLDKAYKWACSLELSAQTAFIALQSGRAGN